MILIVVVLSCFVALCDKLELERVVLITRHGDRAPVFDPLSDQQWDCSTPYETSRSPLFQYSERAVIDGGDNTYNIENLLPLPMAGTCQAGQLTTLGMKEHLKLGQSLKSELIDDLKFLQPEFQKDEIYVESSDQDRTKQSAMALLNGLYPENPGSIPIHIHSPTEEDIFLNFYQTPMACPILADVAKYIQGTQEWSDWEASTLALRKRLSPKLSQPYEDINLFFLRDSLYCYNNNGYTFPKNITQQDWEDINAAATYQYSRLYYGNKTMLRLGIGHFLQRILTNLNFSSFSGKENSQKMFYYSGHDTTIGPLAVLFGFDDALTTWPPYASNLVLASYKNSGTGRPEILATWDGKVQYFRGSGCDVEYCELAKIQEATVSYIPKDWKSECT